MPVQTSGPSLSDRAFEAAEIINALETSEEVADVLTDAASRCGYEHVLCCSWPVMGEPLSKVALLNTLPTGWLTYYDDEGLIDHDVVTNAVFRLTGPYTFAEALEAQSLSKRERGTLAEAAAAGMRDGFMVPVVARRHSGSVYMAGRKPELSEESRSALHAIAMFAHLRLSEMKDGEARPAPASLTRREIEVLRWVSAGKTDWEISILLKVSEHTAYRHVDNIKRKLGAANRVDAVVKAYRNGQLIL